MAFGKGQSGNVGGRPKGSRNKIQQEVIESFAEHWSKHGKDAIEIVFREKPSDYLRFASHFLPKEQITQEVRPESEMSDDDFATALDKLHTVQGGKR